jgi:hypothetical protein
LDGHRGRHGYCHNHLVGRQDRAGKLRHQPWQQREDEMTELAQDSDREFVGLQDRYDTVVGILDSLLPHSKMIIIIALLNERRKALIRNGGLTRPEVTERLFKYLNDFEKESD